MTERAFSRTAWGRKVISATEINISALCLLEMTKELGVNLNACLKLSWACKRPWFYIRSLSRYVFENFSFFSQRANGRVCEKEK